MGSSSGGLCVREGAFYGGFDELDFVAVVAEWFGAFDGGVGATFGSGVIQLCVFQRGCGGVRDPRGGCDVAENDVWVGDCAVLECVSYGGGHVGPVESLTMANFVGGVFQA